MKTQSAFKEWTAVVEALGRGHQTLILRKGGIAEGRTGFQPNHPKFWFFPTQFHQQWERTQPELQALVGSSLPADDQIFVIQYLAEVIHAAYLERWEQVEALRPFHFWKDDLLSERFNYQARPGMTQGLHLLLVRVYRAENPTLLPAAKAFEGCKSWIDIPVDFESITFTPVLSEEDFSHRQREIRAAIDDPQPFPEAA